MPFCCKFIMGKETVGEIGCKTDVYLVVLCGT